MASNGIQYVQSLSICSVSLWFFNIHHYLHRTDAARHRWGCAQGRRGSCSSPEWVVPLGNHRLKSRPFGGACAVPSVCCISMVRLEVRQANQEAARGETPLCVNHQCKGALWRYVQLLFYGPRRDLAAGTNECVFDGASQLTGQNV